MMLMYHDGDDDGYNLCMFDDGRWTMIDGRWTVHNDDVMKFAIPRLQMGIRWIEDALDNESDNHSIYPPRVREYRAW